jgi:hypothetical protein
MFCRQNLEALSRLFAQILRFCPKASAQKVLVAKV